MTLSKVDFEPINRIIQPVLPRFDRLIQSYVFLNLAFFSAIAIETVLLLVFFTFLVKSSLLAFGLAALFLTLFSYFIFRLYYQTAKPERLKEIRDQFVNSCKTVVNYREGEAQHHMAVAQACSRLADNLPGKELSYYRPPKWLETAAPTFEKFSAWWHWQDVHRMRELLLQQSVEEYIKMVKCEPTSMEIHAALANAYVMLSSIYALPARDDPWLQYDKYTQSLPEKFRSTAQKAIEEFKIISDYAPNDPWVHLQLAYSYHDLNMPLEEIREYESIVRLNPDDKEALYKLGALYFSQGMNAKGLRIYDELRKSNFKKAESLIKLYT